MDITNQHKYVSRSRFFIQELLSRINDEGHNMSADVLLSQLKNSSHAVDEIMDQAGIKHVDTEVRAYTLDWIVGKVLHLSLIKELTPSKLDGIIGVTE